MTKQSMGEFDPVGIVPEQQQPPRFPVPEEESHMATDFGLTFDQLDVSALYYRHIFLGKNYKKN